jgi:hypothetical protein
VKKSRTSFREAAADRLSQDRGALPRAMLDFLSDTRQLTVRQLPLELITGHAARDDEVADGAFFATLVTSVRELGVLEPILVRPQEGGRFEVIAGERRLRAARAAGLQTIAAVVRDLDDATAVTLIAARADTGSPRPVERPVNDVHHWRAFSRFRSAPLRSIPAVARDLDHEHRAAQADDRHAAEGHGPAGVEHLPEEERAVAGDDVHHRPRFRLVPLPFLQRDRIPESHDQDD